jgi:hypothetical protein
MSGAEPWIGSYSPFLFASNDADGSMPIEPASIDASSDRMSPKMLPVTITSNCFGARTELHRGVVDVHVRQRDVRIVLAEARDDLAPQDRRVEHVGLVDRAELAAPRTRRLEADARDALDLGTA